MRLWILLLAMMISFLFCQLYSPFPSSLAPSLRWVLLALACGIGTAMARDARPSTPPAKASLRWAALLLAASYGLSSVAGGQLILGILKLAAFLLQVYLFVFLAPRLMRRADWGRVIFYLQWVLFAAVLLAVAMQDFRGGRLSGISNPNSVGLIAMAVVVWMLWDLTEGGSKLLYRVACGAALIISAGALVSTASRSSLAGALGACAVWGWSRRGRRVLSLFVSLFLLVVLALSVGLPAKVSEYFGEQIVRGGMLASRMEIWSACLRSWQRRPWFGHGYGVSGLELTWRPGPSAIGMVRDGAGYAGFLESVGLIGAFCLAVLYVVAWGRTYRLCVLHPRPPDWPTAMKAASLFAALSLNAVGEPWIIAPGALAHALLWFSLGCMESMALWLAYGAAHAHPADWRYCCGIRSAGPRLHAGT